MKNKTKVRRSIIFQAIANGCGFKQCEPREEDGYINPNVLIQSFSPDYLPIIEDGKRIGTEVKNDYRIAIFNKNVSNESNYQVFKDFETMGKNIALTGIEDKEMDYLETI